MSAAEKLRALHETMRLTPGWTARAEIDAKHGLVAALPQIVAVVEAAEVIGIPGRGTELKAALAALDEALT